LLLLIAAALYSLDRATIGKPGGERRNLIRVKAGYLSHGTSCFRKAAGRCTLEFIAPANKIKRCSNQESRMSLFDGSVFIALQPGPLHLIASADPVQG
jgi:hypothetical protein